MNTLTLADRRDSYLRAFPQCADAVWLAGGGRWLYGTWHLGNDYRNASRYYGAYPKGFLRRVDALFPDVSPAKIDRLHAFSGMVAPHEGVTIDLNPDHKPDLCGSVYDIAELTGLRFQFVMADPPYTATDALKYGTLPVDRRRAMSALAAVTLPGGHLVWLDTVWPMHRKAEWHFYGAIQLIRSTNHRVRLVSLFERTAA